MKLLLLAFSFSLCTVVLSSHTVLAVVQDTDLDNLTDDSEQHLYHTDSTLFDTDGDGVGDGEEILDSTNPLDPMSSHLTSLTISEPGILGESEKRAWYFGRATGLTAFLLFTLVIICGLLMKSQLLIRSLPLPMLNSIHEYLSLSALSVALLHMVSFFFDQYLHINLSEALIPFYLERSLTSALGFDIGIAVGLGILATYLALILVATSLYRHKLPLKLWRTLHYLSFLFYLLILLHGLSAGTDSTNHWIQGMYAVSFVVVCVLVIVRIASALKLRRMLAANQPTPHP